MSQQFEMIILAGSAGAYSKIFDFIKNLPPHFPFPVLVVVHRSYSIVDHTEDILNRNNHIIVREIRDKEKIRPGIVYLCPPDYHVLIEQEGVFSLDKSERIWYSRPSIDVALESASEVYKEKLLAILLSGSNQDGAAGLLTVKENNGISIVQSPDEAEFKIMPQAAIDMNAQNMILNSDQIKHYLRTLI